MKPDLEEYLGKDLFLVGRSLRSFASTFTLTQNLDDFDNDSIPEFKDEPDESLRAR